MARARMIRRAESQQVETGDRPRAHGEHVAQDAADPGRRALEGLDEGGMVVDSILKTQASPSPISMTPAFSPGPWITQGAFVGRPRRCLRDDL